MILPFFRLKLKTEGVRYKSNFIGKSVDFMKLKRSFEAELNVERQRLLYHDTTQKIRDCENEAMHWIIRKLG